MPCDVVVKDALVVEPTGSRRASIGISNGQIVALWDTVPQDQIGPRTDLIPGNGLFALPGLINAHTHLFQTLMRGLGDELPGNGWFRDMMLPAAGALSAE